MHPQPHDLQSSFCLATPHPSCHLLQSLPSLYSHPLNPSSFLVIHRFSLFNFPLLFLILFLLCNLFVFFNLFTLCILFCNLLLFLPLLLLQLSSPPPNPLPPSSTSSSSATFLVSLLHPLSPSSSLFSSFPFFF